MDTLTDFPKNDDGSLDLNGIARGLLEGLLNEVMSEQAAELCADSGVARNGYRERRLSTCVGPITLRIPKLREGSYFPDDIVQRWSRTDTALASAVCEMWVNGVSNRKVDAVASEMGVERMSRSRVSRLCRALDGEIAQMRSADLSGRAWPYLWLDATCVKCREAGAARSTAVVVAVAADERARRRVVGLRCIDAESYVAWRDFLIDLRKRGMSGVQLVVSDDHLGLVRAVREVMLGADLLEAAAPDALAYLAFPREHRRWIRTNNLCERMNAEIKRRTRVVQVFPSNESLVRLVGAVCCDQSDEWEVERNFMDARSMAGLAPSAPATDADGGEVARVIRLVEEAFERKLGAA